ncbi:hypothetical protein PDE_02942 [Penicillium oxalicum 114-2]|uniref:Uncharacterized protein n=1 Tax=Penicillium oxalicum (strain 114-2 / CGMCC 5302) TaxID=933388 RepID=S8B0Y2_PENO1|nr:hypothetical protein PDE_02942 [Penicillium oxalicum 114-2]
MRNSEESSITPTHPLLALAKSEGRYCPRGPGVTYSTHLHSASETSGDPSRFCFPSSSPSGEVEGKLLATIPHGRVGAEIVCDDTLVQYAAYYALLARSFLCFGGE